MRTCRTAVLLDALDVSVSLTAGFKEHLKKSSEKTMYLSGVSETLSS